MTFFGCSGSEDSAKSIAQSIKSDIISSGFVPKAEKLLYISTAPSVAGHCT